MVAGDGNYDLVSDGCDIEVAVYDDDLDVAVILGGDVEVSFLKTHLVIADVRTLGLGLCAVCKRDCDILIAHVGGKAGDGLLTAGIDLAVMVAGNGYGHFVGDRGDLQIAVNSFYIELLGNIVAVCVLNNGSTLDNRRVGSRICSLCARREPLYGVVLTVNGKFKSFKARNTLLASIIGNR